MTWAQRGYCLLFAATLGLFLVMVNWSLPTLRAAAGGLTPFDLRPFGYNAEAAREFLSALGPAGMRFYLSVQQRVDSLYPLLLAVTLILGLRHLSRGRPWPVRILPPAMAAAGALFDYLENGAVAGMLNAGAAEVTDQMVATASRWTVLKSTADAIAITALLVLALIAGWRRARGGA